MNYSPERKNEEDSQISRNSKTMKFEDHFSQLSDDCLLDILPRVNHNDLDEVSTLSEKMRILSYLSRTRAIKVFANDLLVKQVTNEQFQIVVATTNEEKFFVDNRNQYEISEKMRPYTTRDEKERMSDKRPQKQIISEIVANRIIALADRFDFEYTIFKWVSFDNNFIRCIEKLSRSNYLQIFVAKDCTMDENLTEEGRKRFLSTLLIIKPTYLYLWCNSLFIDEHFIKEYADAVLCGEFYHYDFDAARFTFDKKFKDTLWKYKTLDVTRMVVDVNCLIPMILKRLHQKMKGFWWFVITRQFTQDDIPDDFPSDIQCTFSRSVDGNDVFAIEIIGTIHKAIISQMPIPNTVRWTVKVDFN